MSTFAKSSNKKVENKPRPKTTDCRCRCIGEKEIERIVNEKIRDAYTYIDRHCAKIDKCNKSLKEQLDTEIKKIDVLDTEVKKSVKKKTITPLIIPEGFGRKVHEQTESSALKVDPIIKKKFIPMDKLSRIEAPSTYTPFGMGA